MGKPSLSFLCDSIATTLLDYFGVEGPPVPVRTMVQSPPDDLSNDLSLTEGLPFGDALWLRLMGGRGVVFVNPGLSERERRYAMARALFTGLCASKGGKAVGLPDVPNNDLAAQAALFARLLLMPVDLFPDDWQMMSAADLAGLFIVPVPVAEARVVELGAG